MSEGPDRYELLERMLRWLVAAPAWIGPPMDPSVEGPGLGLSPTRYSEAEPSEQPPISPHYSALSLDITAAGLSGDYVEFISNVQDSYVFEVSSAFILDPQTLWYTNVFGEPPE